MHDVSAELDVADERTRLARLAGPRDADRTTRPGLDRLRKAATAQGYTLHVGPLTIRLVSPQGRSLVFGAVAPLEAFLNVRRLPPPAPRKRQA